MKFFYFFWIFSTLHTDWNSLLQIHTKTTRAFQKIRAVSKDKKNSIYSISEIFEIEEEKGYQMTYHNNKNGVSICTDD